jgi:hypothetical protein
LLENSFFFRRASECIGEALIEKMGVDAEHGIARWRVLMPNNCWCGRRCFSAAARDARDARGIYAFTATAKAISKYEDP